MNELAPSKDQLTEQMIQTLLADAQFDINRGRALDSQPVFAWALEQLCSAALKQRSTHEPEALRQYAPSTREDDGEFIAGQRRCAATAQRVELTRVDFFRLLSLAERGSRPSPPPEAWRSALIDKPTEADGPVVLVFTGEAYSVEYPGDVNGVEHIAWHRITPYTRPTKPDEQS
jgi:hypothetical protein